jgi:hypothetical protein
MSTTQTSTETVRGPAETSMSSQILGTVFNPLVRRFLGRHGSLATVTPKEGKTGFQKNVQVNLTDLTEFMLWSRYASIVRYRRLHIELQPAMAAMTGSVTGLAAWIPNLETFPVVYSEFNKQPNAVTFKMGPMAPGGVANSVIIDCPFTYGVQRQLKPTPLVGGPPKFVLTASYSPLPHHTSSGWKVAPIPAGQTVFRVIFDFEVEWVPSL